tara:strand:- start:1017 stop:1271 length:255 start_codon:yes stop_codon:yes gene_type:complete
VTWRVVWTAKARKTLARVQPPAQRLRIAKAVQRFAETGQGDVKKLKGYDDEYRLRVGEYRVRFTLQPATQTIVVLLVFHRQGGY